MAVGQMGFFHVQFAASVPDGPPVDYGLFIIGFPYGPQLLGRRSIPPLRIMKEKEL
jgi:hypothetical protein